MITSLQCTTSFLLPTRFIGGYSIIRLYIHISTLNLSNQYYHEHLISLGCRAVIVIAILVPRSGNHNFNVSPCIMPELARAKQFITCVYPEDQCMLAKFPKVQKLNVLSYCMYVSHVFSDQMSRLAR